MELSGPGVAKTWLNVLTRDMPPLPYPEWGDPRYLVQSCFGARFDLTAEPEQPITGTVRDAESGLPLTGVEVRLNQYAGTNFLVEGFLSATTDAQGRYTLHGAPKPNDPERGHRLRLIPQIDQPYFRTELDVPKREGLGAVTSDAALKRAIMVRGRIADAVTGRPVRGMVIYRPFLSNELAGRYPHFGNEMLDRYPTRDDGAYQLPALPGRGLVAFIASQADRYPEADGIDSIAKGLQKDGGGLKVAGGSDLEMATALREINPPPEATEAACDIELRPLDVARIELFDPDVRPLAGVVTKHAAPTRKTVGYFYHWSNAQLPTSIAEIVGPREQPRHHAVFTCEKETGGRRAAFARRGPAQATRAASVRRDQGARCGP